MNTRHSGEGEQEANRRSNDSERRNKCESMETITAFAAPIR